MAKNSARLGVYLPVHLHKALKEISNESGFTVNQLSLMSLNSLVCNWDQRGYLIFTDFIFSEKQ